MASPPVERIQALPRMKQRKDAIIARMKKPKRLPPFKAQKPFPNVKGGVRPPDVVGPNVKGKKPPRIQY